VGSVWLSAKSPCRYAATGSGVPAPCGEHGSCRIQDALRLFDARGVFLIVLDDTIKEAGRRQLFRVAYHNQLCTTRNGSERILWFDLGASSITTRSKAILPGARYWATDIGPIMKHGFNATSALPGLCSNCLIGKCRVF
jgi:hypothetical protein